MDNDIVVYPAIFEPDGDYTLVTIPDIKHSTEGDNLIDAVKMAEDLIGITLEDQDTFPPATDIKDITLTPTQNIAYVSVDMFDYRRKHSKIIRKNVTIPEYLNKIAKERHINVSQVLTEALHKKLNA